jgi:MerR family transcriptional regulator, light-induced transcriptional regulator
MKPSANYSIKDLEKLSGIKAHTLRIWEKRYALFEPDRTDTNIRFYSNEDLKRILSISILNKNGIKISKIALMSDAQITAKVLEFNLVRTEYEDLISNLIVGLIDMDEEYFERIFSSAILRIGFENTVQHVIFPFFGRIGVMWQTGAINPAQEHFASNIIRQKLIVAIDGIKNIQNEKLKTAVLFLPEQEMHELSLLYYNYGLRARKYKTFYLGQMVPIADLIRVADIVKPDLIISVVTTPYEKEELKSLINSLHKIRHKKKVLLSGHALKDYDSRLPSSVFTFKSMDELAGLI